MDPVEEFDNDWEDDLLEEGVPADRKKTDPRFYSFRDAVYTDKTVAERLLAEDPALIEIRSSTGETVLHYLVVENEQESVAWLVERGARIDNVNEFGDTPLMDASALGYTELCRYLIEHGADLRHINAEDETSVFSKAATTTTPVIATLQMLLDYWPTDEDIQPYFSEWEVSQVQRIGGGVAELLTKRGLRLQ